VRRHHRVVAVAAAVAGCVAVIALARPAPAPAAPTAVAPAVASHAHPATPHHHRRPAVDGRAALVSRFAAAYLADRPNPRWANALARYVTEDLAGALHVTVPARAHHGWGPPAAAAVSGRTVVVRYAAHTLTVTVVPAVGGWLVADVAAA
jgi:hypothetical protein